MLGLSLPIVLLRPGERLRGFAVLLALGIGGGLLLNPVIAVLRTVADRF